MVRVAISFILGMLVALIAWAQTPTNREPGYVFRDCSDCPDMVVVPRGEILMGSNEGTPFDGSAWTTGDCTDRVIRGGNWYNPPWFLRASARLARNFAFRDDGTGFRLARMLE
jgi:formylglycine-generating enzyme required for sulfatase activity